MGNRLPTVTHKNVIIIIIIIRNICSAPFTDKIRTAVHYIVSKKQKLTIKSSVRKKAMLSQR